jgi:hypothetical protein
MTYHRQGEDKAKILSKIEKHEDVELSGKMLVLKTLLKEWKGTDNKVRKTLHFLFSFLFSLLHPD